MVTQLLFGEAFEIIEAHEIWSLIRVIADGCKGWITNKQYQSLGERDFLAYQNMPDRFLTDLVDYAVDSNQLLMPLSMGANLKAVNIMDLSCDGEANAKKLGKRQITQLAVSYLNAPSLSGGKTPFGIDCSGFVQVVYKIAGYPLFREVSQQARQGKALSFIEECEPGDLAFFDNEEGEITHVGMILKNNHIIHASGKVRIDRLDHTGIFKTKINDYSHQLRVLKAMV